MPSASPSSHHQPQSSQTSIKKGREKIQLQSLGAAIILFNSLLVASDDLCILELSDMRTVSGNPNSIAGSIRPTLVQKLCGNSATLAPSWSINTYNCSLLVELLQNGTNLTNFSSQAVSGCKQSWFSRCSYMLENAWICVGIVVNCPWISYNNFQRAESWGKILVWRS